MSTFKFVHVTDGGCKLFVDGIFTRIIKDPNPDIDLRDGSSKITITPATGVPFTMDTAVDSIILPGETDPTELGIEALSEVLATEGFFSTATGGGGEAAVDGGVVKAVDGLSVFRVLAGEDIDNDLASGMIIEAYGQDYSLTGDPINDLHPLAGTLLMRIISTWGSTLKLAPGTLLEIQDANGVNRVRIGENFVIIDDATLTGTLNLPAPGVNESHFIKVQGSNGFSETTRQGYVIGRMTQAQRDAAVTLSEALEKGFLIFNTDANQYETFNIGTMWDRMASEFDATDQHHAYWYVATSGTTGAIVTVGTSAAIASNGGSTPTARSVTAGSLMSQANRIALITTTTVNTSAGIRHTSTMYHRGAAAGLGGFKFKAKFFFSAAAPVATRKFFYGMIGQSAFITAGTLPSALVNCIGFSADLELSNNLQIHSNDASGVGTVTDLGASFPANTNSTDFYEIMLVCEPFDTKIRYAIKNLTTGAVAVGLVTDTLPVDTQMMGWQSYLCNGNTALVDSFDSVSIHATKPN